MREGSLEPPTRHPLDWREPDFLDPAKVDEELRRVFDICHTCRRCFNLCDSFPRLFDLIDESKSGEVESVASKDFSSVVEACTLCDMCFMTKCPYVPPHEWNVDFPHLMLRARMAEEKQKGGNFTARELAKMDRNGSAVRVIAPIANAMTSLKNKPARKALAALAGIDSRAELPKFNFRTFVMRARKAPMRVNETAPAYRKRKALLFPTCFVNYNKPETGMAARALLNHLGIETKTLYPGCCGMPYLEQGQLDRVEVQAKKLSTEFRPLIDQGYDVIALTASCGLMLKFEWPLLLPNDENVAALAKATYDVDEYVVSIARKEGLPEGMTPIEGGVSVHLACHARAQNMGPKAAEMLKLIPGTEIDVIERCAGHGGTFGVLKPTHEVARKVGAPVFRALAKQNRRHIVSDCPLAAKHIVQGAHELAEKEGRALAVRAPEHPVEIMARAYGLVS